MGNSNCPLPGYLLQLSIHQANVKGEDRSTFFYLMKQLRFVILGLTALYICSRIPFGMVQDASYMGMILSIGLLIATMLIGSKLMMQRDGSQSGVSFSTQ